MFFKKDGISARQDGRRVSDTRLSERSNFQVEALEPRLLLSSDLAPATGGLVAVQELGAPQSAIVEFAQESRIAVSLDGWGSGENTDEQPAPPAEITPDSAESQLVAAADPGQNFEPEITVVMADETASIAASSSAAATDSGTKKVHDDDAPAGPAADPETGSDTVENLVKSLRSANGPPQDKFPFAGLDFSSAENRGRVISIFVRANGTVDVLGAVEGDTSSLNVTYIIGNDDAEIELTAPDVENVWQIFGPNSGVLQSSGLGAIEFTDVQILVGGQSSDTLDYSSYSTSVVVDFSNGVATDVTEIRGIENAIGGSGDDTFIVDGAGVDGSGESVGFISGGEGSDTLQAIDGSNVWLIDGVNAGRLNAIAFTSVENLVGGAGNDVFVFFVAARLSGFISGGGAADTLIGANQHNTWIVSSANAGTLNGIAFREIENLYGGADDDVFVFSRGFITGVLDGGDGLNTVELADPDRPVSGPAPAADAASSPTSEATTPDTAGSATNDLADTDQASTARIAETSNSGAAFAPGAEEAAVESAVPAPLVAPDSSPAEAGGEAVPVAGLPTDNPALPARSEDSAVRVTETSAFRAQLTEVLSYAITVSYAGFLLGVATGQLDPQKWILGTSPVDPSDPPNPPQVSDDESTGDGLPGAGEDAAAPAPPAELSSSSVSVSSGDVVTPASVPPDSEPSGGGSNGSAGSIIDQLTETLKAANAPPADSAYALTSADESASSVSEVLSSEDLAPIFEQAISAWIASGISGDQAALLNSITIAIVSLSDGRLGETSGTSVYLDATAAGHGWFVDGTPADSDEFEIVWSGGRLIAGPNSVASGRIDLLTTLIHEMGHVLGLTHDSGLAVMDETLRTGERVPLPLVAQIPVGSDPVSAAVINPAGTLDLSGDGGTITITVQSNGSLDVSGSSTDDGNQAGITVIKGNPVAGTITLTGPDENTTWTLTGGNEGSLSFEYLASTITITFTDIDHLVGGSANDTFVANPLEGVAADINGGGAAGVDILMAVAGSAAITLSDASLGSISLNSSFEIAILTGTSVNAVLADASGFSGVVIYDSGITAAWTPQGPGPATEATPSVVDQYSGAIQAVAVNPVDPTIMYVGAVNGGVWKTTDGGANWTPLTDEMPSLATSALTLDLDDPETIYVGTGSLSSFRFEGGEAAGVLKSTDGGKHWTVLLNGLRGDTIRGIVAKGNMILVATDKGLYRAEDGETFYYLDFPNSVGMDDDGDMITDEQGVIKVEIVNGGTGLALEQVITANVSGMGVTAHSQATFKVTEVNGGVAKALSLTSAGEYTGLSGMLMAGALTISPIGGNSLSLKLTFSKNEFNLPNTAAVSELSAATDPALVIYAAFPGIGVFRSDDSGKHWLNVSSNLSEELFKNSQRVRLTSVGNTVYAALLSSKSNLYADVSSGNTIQLKREAPFYVPYKVGDSITLENAAGEKDTLKVTAVDNLHVNYTSVTLSGPVTHAYVAGDKVDSGKLRLGALYKSTNKGETWSSVDLPGVAAEGGVNVGGQGTKHFSIVADPADPDILYVGGDTTASSPFSGNLFRLSGSTWDSIVKSGTSMSDPQHPQGTAPHADSRNMVFSGPNLIEVDDGGIYILTDPDSAADRVWTSISGNLSLFEFVSIAWDSVNDLITGGAQDNGSLRQSGTGSQQWTIILGGDGVNTVSGANAAGTIGYTYTSTQDLGNFEKITDPIGSAATAEILDLEINGTGIFDDDEIRHPVGTSDPEFIDKTLFNDFRFGTPIAINAIDPEKFLIGTEVIYEEDPDTFFPDRGEDVSLVNGKPIWHLTSESQLPETARIGSVQALAYGGYELVGGTLMPKEYIAYAVVQNVTPGASGTVDGAAERLSSGSLWVRLGSAGGGYRFIKDPTFTTALGSAIPIDIALDPNDWRRVFVLDNQGRIWYNRLQTSDATPTSSVMFDGAWVDLTANGNLGDLTWGVRAIEVAVVDPKNVAMAEDDVIAVLVGAQGGVYQANVDLANLPSAMNPLYFHGFGYGLPNVVAKDLIYDKQDNVLVVGTLGRGAWIMQNALAAMQTESQLVILGSKSAMTGDQIKLQRNASAPWMMDVVVSGMVVRTLPMKPIGKILINTREGDDHILIDGDNGPVAPSERIFIDGAAGTDELRVENHLRDRGHVPASGIPADGKYRFVDRDPYAPGGVSFVNITATNIESLPYVVRSNPIPTTHVTEVTIQDSAPLDGSWALNLDGSPVMVAYAEM
ncbi:MAG TPA: LEPR-XLL domain-containing protein, partial [Terriglobia bacterium]|nr:LEPR-XLL domain-containing protein [Terriglobia bacterium]